MTEKSPCMTNACKRLIKMCRELNFSPHLICGICDTCIIVARLFKISPENHSSNWLHLTLTMSGSRIVIFFPWLFLDYIYSSTDSASIHANCIRTPNTVRGRKNQKLSKSLIHPVNVDHVYRAIALSFVLTFFPIKNFIIFFFSKRFPFMCRILTHIWCDDVQFHEPNARNKSICFLFRFINFQFSFYLSPFLLDRTTKCCKF